MTTEHISDKSRFLMLLLCFFLGVFGIHRFYAGKIGTGLLMLITFGGFFVWVVIDLVMIILGSFTDSDEKVILYWGF